MSQTLNYKSTDSESTALMNFIKFQIKVFIFQFRHETFSFKIILRLCLTTEQFLNIAKN